MSDAQIIWVLIGIAGFAVAVVVIAALVIIVTAYKMKDGM